MRSPALGMPWGRCHGCELNLSPCSGSRGEAGKVFWAPSGDVGAGLGRASDTAGGAALPGEGTGGGTGVSVSQRTSRAQLCGKTPPRSDDQDKGTRRAALTPAQPSSVGAGMEIPAQGNAQCSTGPACGVTAVLNPPSSAPPALPGAERGSGVARKSQCQGLSKNRRQKQTGKGDSGPWGLQQRHRNGHKWGI